MLFGNHLDSLPKVEGIHSVTRMAQFTSTYMHECMHVGVLVCIYVAPACTCSRYLDNLAGSCPMGEEEAHFQGHLESTEVNIEKACERDATRMSTVFILGL